jgi:hypothetical protein
MYKGMGMSLDDNRKEQDKLTGKINAKGRNANHQLEYNIAKTSLRVLHQKG